ncbi:MAG: HAD-IIIA family hydrolase [Nitrospira sp.]|nr:HAD-IIIA family hydrolase [Nitrospira sp.]
MRLVLAEDGVTLDGVYFCPHHPDDRCNCRKPARGMIDRASAELQVDLARAYVVGDSARDVELARQVGAQGILVMTGPSGAEALADLTARDLSSTTWPKTLAGGGLDCRPCDASTGCRFVAMMEPSCLVAE